MLTQQRAQILSNSKWQVPLAICFLLVVFLLVAGTIVLALIPVYLKPKNIDSAIRNKQLLNAAYASDVTDGQLLVLSNKNDLSTQMTKKIPRAKYSMKMESGQFSSATATSKKKRDISNAKMTCEQPTGLDGNIFIVGYMMTYPEACIKADCQQRYLDNMENAIRVDHQHIDVTMEFTDGEIRTVQLAFCSFSSTVISNITTATTLSSCISQTSTVIYLLDQDANFFSFHPTTYTITYLTTLNCSTTSYPYSLAIQQNGQAWTLYTDGSLYTFHINNLQCQTTSYLYDSEDLVLFGMNFAKDPSTNTEILYISSDASNPSYRLGILDLNSFEISFIGHYDSMNGRAELTTTQDGRLYGLFEGIPYTIAQINQTNAQIISKTSQNPIQYTSDSSYFAFTFYLSNFYLFVGNYSVTDIYLYNISSGSTSKAATISNGIVGANVLVSTSGCSI